MERDRFAELGLGHRIADQDIYLLAGSVLAQIFAFNEVAGYVWNAKGEDILNKIQQAHEAMVSQANR